MTITPVSTAEHLCRPNHPAGLGGLIALIEGVETALPLTEVRVRTQIVGDCARTVVEQRFENPYSVPLEVVHQFPLPEDGAVVSLILKAGETVIQGVCQEKQQAEQAFAAAREAGHRAALLVQERADVHTLRVTRIPPNESVRVELIVVERLERVDGRYRWRFPTVIAPRYLPGTAIGHSGSGVLPATDRVPDADRVQPPLRLAGGTKLDLEVELQGPVRNLQCAQHAFRIDLDTSVRVAPSASSTLDRDFVLAFSTAKDDQLASRAWTDGAHTLLTIEAPAVRLPRTLPRDAIFVVDISGSMDGTKLDAAKRALTAAIRGLGDGDRFRIVAFDDRIEAMSPELLPFDQAHLQRADAFIGALEARGGTEMLPAIQEALKGDRPAGRSRSVLFITDGQAWNEAELTAAVANRCNGARFFTFGIDTAVNSALLSRLARVGGGTCELATPSDDIEEALANLEARFGNPVLDGLHVQGLLAARLTPAALFTGRAATLLFEGAPTTLEIEGVGPEGPVRFSVTAQRTGFVLGPLWARERVSALEDRLLLKPFEEEALRFEILRIALAHGIASRFTAFVAVDRGRVVDGPMREVVQPAELPDAWSAPLGGAAPPPAPPGGTRSQSVARPSRARMRAFEVADDEASEGAVDVVHAYAPRAEPAPSMAPRMEKKKAPAPSVLNRVGDAATGMVDRLFSRDEERSRAPADGSAPDESTLARSQAADGSFGGDLRRTVAALLTLLLGGHTRRTGSRRRTVAKAATWLEGRTEPEALLALAALTKAEAGEPVVAGPAWSSLHDAGVEGEALRLAMR